MDDRKMDALLALIERLLNLHKQMLEVPGIKGLLPGTQTFLFEIADLERTIQGLREETESTG
jgi:hypothetical protein